MAVKSKSKRLAKKSKGLTAKTFSGLNQKRMESKGGGNRVVIKQGQTMPVQFLQKPSQFTEFDQHQWREDGTWMYVPCAGDDCPNCDSEDEVRSKLNYKFVANVYNVKEKKVQLLEGPKTLATQIFDRYKRKPESFMKRVFDVTKFPTQPVTYGFGIAEESPVKTSGLKLIDIDAYIQGELDRFLGNDTPKSKGKGKTALDDDDFDDEEDIEDDDEFEDEDELDDDDDDEEEDGDDDEDEDEESEDPDEDEMLDKEAWSWSDLKSYAGDIGVKNVKKHTKRSELVKAIIKKRGF